MTRGEKIGGSVLGVALFAGLFYFIYTSYMNQASPAGELAGANEESFLRAEDEDFGEDLAEESSDEEDSEPLSSMSKVKTPASKPK